MEQYIKFWEQAIKETEKFKVDNLTASYDERLFKPIGELNNIDWDANAIIFFKMLVIDYLKNKHDFDIEKDIKEVILICFILGSVYNIEQSKIIK
jgi:hypothetical protein